MALVGGVGLFLDDGELSRGGRFQGVGQLGIQREHGIHGIAGVGNRRAEVTDLHRGKGGAFIRRA